MANSPQVERPMTREELMAMREVAAKAWKAGRATECDDMTWPNLVAYLDREYPLPAPEPQQAQGPSGTVYTLARDDKAGETRLLHDAVRLNRYLPQDVPWRADDTLLLALCDRATVANLLVPFEDVVRATLEEMGVSQIVAGPAWEPSKSFCARVATIAPAILKRLEVPHDFSSWLALHLCLVRCS